jgi:hypothetical protein
MWLIDTNSMIMEDVLNVEDYQYAILSHTWGDDEVTFQEMTLQPLLAKAKKGYRKIAMTCNLAKKRGIRYAWVDTCCIDKTSSAALSEAINSMFQWYQQALICFAYLADMPAKNPRTLAQCRWFTRGWTLQELIAPENLEFYDAEWQLFSTKIAQEKEISKITGINIRILQSGGSSNLSHIPVGRKMSWASKRQTTRIEDLAYCLLGIFDISMPMLYGEGPKAFVRLQEEIARNTNDLTLFAWTALDETPSSPVGSSVGSLTSSAPCLFRGILATSPAEFRNCRYLDTTPAFHGRRLRREYSITNNGVRIDTYLACHGRDAILDLGCTEERRDEDAPFDPRLIGIHLMLANGCYVRSRANKLFRASDWHYWNGPRSTIYIQKHVKPPELSFLGALRESRWVFDFNLPHGWNVRGISATPAENWDISTHTYYAYPDDEMKVIEFQVGYAKGKLYTFFIVCGCVSQWAPEHKNVLPTFGELNGILVADADPGYASHVHILKDWKERVNTSNLQDMRSLRESLAAVHQLQLRGAKAGAIMEGKLKYPYQLVIGSHYLNGDDSPVVRVKVTIKREME